MQIQRLHRLRPHQLRLGMIFAGGGRAHPGLRSAPLVVPDYHLTPDPPSLSGGPQVGQEHPLKRGHKEPYGPPMNQAGLVQPSGHFFGA